MSYTTLYKVTARGDVVEVEDFRNAFRGAWMVWDQMCKKYLNQDAAYLMGSPEKMQPVWDLWKDSEINLNHRIVLMTTFDKVMVRRERLRVLITAIEDYAKPFDPGHLLLQVPQLEKLAADEDCYAVCWNQTSVCESFWNVEEGEEGRPYNIFKDAGHWFLFEEIEGG